MPDSGWNGKYEAVGNGGWSGSISYSAMAAAVTAGYVASSTDTGHIGSSASFAPGHPEKLIDYAYRSEHEMTVTAKALIAAFYGDGPKVSYWNGCSAGGKQGLMEAQRYPGDFDGILAGSPAANWTGRAAQSIWVAQALHKDDASYIPPDLYPALHRAVLDACDAIDGVKDGVLENPRASHFDPEVLLCKVGESRNCLNAAQVEAARKIYAPSVNPRTCKRLYAGLEPGGELQWQVWGGPRPLSIGLDYFRYVVFEDPKWDYQALDFDGGVARAEELDHSRINALDPDLKSFFARGGKLIQYHGWSDPQISPGNSVDYYQSVEARMGKVDDWYRLFMVPGMAHCGGGEGATSFDAMPALERWVEQKRAPGAIIASGAAPRRIGRIHSARSRRSRSTKAPETPRTRETGCVANRGLPIEPTIYIHIDQNPNCEAMDGQVFQPRTTPRAVVKVRAERHGVERWFDVSGVDRDWQLCQALASLIDDSGDGACYLITGGEWGLRLSDDGEQWGAPYLMLPGDGSDVRFS